MARLTRRAILSLPVVTWLSANLPAFAQISPRKRAAGDTDWTNYANDLANTRYAPLDQINASNFNDLEIAWRFKTDALGPRPEFVYEGTPLIINGVIYATGGSRRDIVALDGATGELLWVHREDEGARANNAPRKLSGRGLS